MLILFPFLFSKTSARKLILRERERVLWAEIVMVSSPETISGMFTFSEERWEDVLSVFFTITS